VKYFYKRFIFKICLDFRLFLSKLPMSCASFPPLLQSAEEKGLQIQTGADSVQAYPKKRKAGCTLLREHRSIRKDGERKAPSPRSRGRAIRNESIKRTARGGG
jgi:hypothetical protein